MIGAANTIWDALQKPVPDILEILEPDLALCDAYAADAWLAAQAHGWPDDDLTEDQREARRTFADLRREFQKYPNLGDDDGIPDRPGSRPLRPAVMARLGARLGIDPLPRV